ncbi:hypothetical protein [Lentibacillus sp. CBA3610]|uniref:hypothetical protein n=1 Tax=Lentibacillus sp. CBA3610 TaxID=2518176 RepID=UPI00159550C8|nr:hypothetical protein [Lentibacillus sp. CBA3610]QKY70001.1 hypothetical protein Len3610_10725 [Lentibacillus sp. CBA3610]
MDKQMAHMEDMLSQLITMVGSMRTEQTEMKEKLTGIENEQAEMKERLTGIENEQSAMKKDLNTLKEDQWTMKTESDRRHREIMDEFKILRADQDHIWNKTVHNERDIAQLKYQVSN